MLATVVSAHGNKGTLLKENIFEVKYLEFIFYFIAGVHMMPATQPGPLLASQL
jgi:hypothetical protein